MTNPILNHLCVPCIIFGSSLYMLGCSELCTPYCSWLSFCLTTDSMPLKRQLVNGCYRQAEERQPECTGDLDDAMTESKAKRSRADRNKKNFYEHNRHRLPKRMVLMIQSLACFQRGKLVNDLVEDDPTGGWRFNTSHPHVQDCLCATVLYTRSTV